MSNLMSSKTPTLALLPCKKFGDHLQSKVNFAFLALPVILKISFHRQSSRILEKNSIIITKRKRYRVLLMKTSRTPKKMFKFPIDTHKKKYGLVMHSLTHLRNMG